MAAASSSNLTSGNVDTNTPLADSHTHDSELLKLGVCCLPPYDVMRLLVLPSDQPPTAIKDILTRGQRLAKINASCCLPSLSNLVRQVSEFEATRHSNLSTPQKTQVNVQLSRRDVERVHANIIQVREQMNDLWMLIRDMKRCTNIATETMRFTRSCRYARPQDLQRIKDDLLKIRPQVQLDIYRQAKACEVWCLEDLQKVCDLLGINLAQSLPNEFSLENGQIMCKDPHEVNCFVFEGNTKKQIEKIKDKIHEITQKLQKPLGVIAHEKVSPQMLCYANISSMLLHMQGTNCDDIIQQIAVPLIRLLFGDRLSNVDSSQPIMNMSFGSTELSFLKDMLSATLVSTAQKARGCIPGIYDELTLSYDKQTYTGHSTLLDLRSVSSIANLTDVLHQKHQSMCLYSKNGTITPTKTLTCDASICIKSNVNIAVSKNIICQSANALRNHIDRKLNGALAAAGGVIAQQSGNPFPTDATWPEFIFGNFITVQELANLLSDKVIVDIVKEQATRTIGNCRGFSHFLDKKNLAFKACLVGLFFEFMELEADISDRQKEQCIQYITQVVDNIPPSTIGQALTEVEEYVNTDLDSDSSHQHRLTYLSYLSSNYSLMARYKPPIERVIRKWQDKDHLFSYLKNEITRLFTPRAGDTDIKWTKEHTEAILAMRSFYQQNIENIFIPPDRDSQVWQDAYNSPKRSKLSSLKSNLKKSCMEQLQLCKDYIEINLIESCAYDDMSNTGALSLDELAQLLSIFNIETPVQQKIRPQLETKIEKLLEDTEKNYNYSIMRCIAFASRDKMSMLLEEVENILQLEEKINILMTIKSGRKSQDNLIARVVFLTDTFTRHYQKKSLSETEKDIIKQCKRVLPFTFSAKRFIRKNSSEYTEICAFLEYLTIIFRSLNDSVYEERAYNATAFLKTIMFCFENTDLSQQQQQQQQQTLKLADCLEKRCSVSTFIKEHPREEKNILAWYADGDKDLASERSMHFNLKNIPKKATKIVQKQLNLKYSNSTGSSMTRTKDVTSEIQGIVSAKYEDSLVKNKVPQSFEVSSFYYDSWNHTDHQQRDPRFSFLLETRKIPPADQTGRTQVGILYYFGGNELIAEQSTWEAYPYNKVEETLQTDPSIKSSIDLTKALTEAADDTLDDKRPDKPTCFHEAVIEAFRDHPDGKDITNAVLQCCSQNYLSWINDCIQSTGEFLVIRRLPLIYWKPKKDLWINESGNPPNKNSGCEFRVIQNDLSSHATLIITQKILLSEGEFFVRKDSLDQKLTQKIDPSILEKNELTITIEVSIGAGSEDDSLQGAVGGLPAASLNQGEDIRPIITKAKIHQKLESIADIAYRYSI